MKYFRSRSLKVPEVLAVGHDEPVQLKVSGRNVNGAQLSVYKVDLMKFYQNRKSLADLGQMNLAGIKPTWEGTVDLGPKPFVDKEKTIDLPLKEKGAYFIMAARALGLDCGPMSGFDQQKVNAEFFPDGKWKANFLCNLGYGDPSNLFPRNPRLNFDEACRVL